jgi:hypothetical protein
MRPGACLGAELGGFYASAGAAIKKLGARVLLRRLGGSLGPTSP